MNKVTLKAEERKLTGRKVKRLRKENKLPANIYGKKIKSKTVQVDLKEFQNVFEEVGETGLVELTIGKQKNPVLIHNTQVDPLTDQYIHADFFQVNLKEKVTSQVPVEFIGDSPAEKEFGATVVKYIDEIEVEALPTDLPEKFEVDISVLKELDSTILVSDLKVDKAKVDVKNDAEQVIAKAEPPREEEEEPVVTSGSEEQQEEEEPAGEEKRNAKEGEPSNEPQSDGNKD